MKSEEAIEYFVDRIDYLKRYERPDLIKHYELAIEALEKQVPKKPIKLPQEETFYDGGYHDHKCKICDIPLNKNMVYCDKCGNKIDWGSEK